VALAACDPANAYGAVLPWPQSDGRMARAAGAYCVLDSGRLVLYLERGGRSLLTNGEIRSEHVRTLLGVATRAGRVEIQRVDGLPVMESPIAALLRESGFASTHRGLIAHDGRSGRP
jgi:ATP-dependent Lhr-like helicase